MFELLRFLPFLAQHQGHQLILATIVATKGSSYRKTGTQMLIAEDYSYQGQLSGGCVEKEVFRQCVSVFAGKGPKVFEYDGTYRLGCKGIITVLLESVPSPMKDEIRQLLTESASLREGLSLIISKQEGMFATAFEARGKRLNTSEVEHPESVRELMIPAQRKLLVIGSEYDAGILCQMALSAGFDVVRAVHQHFLITDSLPYRLMSGVPGEAEILQQIDPRTAIVLMTHSWSNDLIWLSKLQSIDSVYLGVLGPKQRKEELVDALIGKYEVTDPEFIDRIHGPIGLKISSRTAEEIAISVVAELIQVFAVSERG